MKKYFDTVANANGSPVNGASVSVFNFGTQTLSSIYSDASGTSSISNPITTNSRGYFEFYAADGRYSLQISGTGFTTLSISDILLDDPANASSAVISGGSIDGTPIGAISPSTGAFTSLSATSATLANATLPSPAITTPTGIVKSDVGLGNVDNTSDATKNAAVATLTNKTLTTPVLSNPSYSGTTANGGTVTTIDINGGTIDGAVIGGTTPAAGSFTSLSGGTGGTGYSFSASAPANSLTLQSTGRLDVVTDSTRIVLLNKVTPSQSQSLIGPTADLSNITLQAGSTAGFFSAVEVMGWNGTGNAPRVSVYAAGTEVARATTTGLAVTGNISATGNVTVGDASTDTLIVQAGSAALPSIIPTGDPNTGVWFPAADTVAVSTAGSERLRVDSAGNLSLSSGSMTISSFTTATKPAHAAGKMIYVSDGGAGAVFQGSNGSAWVNLG